MQATLRVKRKLPEQKPEPYYQDFTLELDEHDTLLEALIKAKDQVDGSLSFRYSCRSSICGSCAMKVNGRTRLVCKTKASGELRGGTVVIEPMGNMPQLKDLVTDMSAFWDSVDAVRPWLQPRQLPPDDREFFVSEEARFEQEEVANCIMCACCVSDCLSRETDPNFLGPAALAKAYRFVSDPRDGKRQERLRELSEPGGIWDCTHCFWCIESCPKGVNPMEQIMKMRELAHAAGVRNPGVFHGNDFERSVRRAGHLNEATLPVFSSGLLNVKAQVEILPSAVRLIRARKLPPAFIVPIRGIDHVRRIFDETGAQRRAELKQRFRGAGQPVHAAAPAAGAGGPA
ncbi:MAG: succinate dehydrogenase/fumarate reductase iron-sulfur subunit [Candidatus Dormibacteria bacterium]